MSAVELLALAVALSMDAFAVAVCAGCALRTVSARHYVRLSLTFGFFQFFMPVAGWYLGLSVRHVIEAWDHWVAFLLLAWIGGGMIRGAFSDESCPVRDPTQGKKLFVLAVATSIDALAVGFSFSLLHIDVWKPALLIGGVCALITSGGLLAGTLLAHADLFGRRVGFAGGAVLLAIGLRILYEHGVFKTFIAG